MPTKRSYKSEEQFKALLDALKLPYLDIHQEKGSLPAYLKDAGKRVDFIIFIPGKGILAIDAKERNDSPDRFDIAITDAQQLREFEKRTGIHTYVAFLYAPPDGQSRWYFIDTYSIASRRGGFVTDDARRKRLIIDKNACSVTKTDDINPGFFERYLNKYSEYVMTPNPNVQKPKKST